MFFTLIFPSTSKAGYLYNGVEYSQKAELIYYDCGNVSDGSGTQTRQEIPHNVTVYSSNPDAELYLVHYVRYPGSTGSMANSCVACVSVGSDTTVTCIVDDTVIAENKSLVALNMDYLNENPTTPFYSLSSEYGVYRFKASKTNQQGMGDPVPHCTPLLGNVIDIPTDGFFGSMVSTAELFVSTMNKYNASGSEENAGVIDISLVEIALDLLRQLLLLFKEYPLNVILIFTLIGMSFGLYRKGRKSVR